MTEGDNEQQGSQARSLLHKVASDPRYGELVARRSRLGWLLTFIILVVFFGYILLIAFDRAFLAQRVAGQATTLGIPLGIAVILIGIVLTGVYVRVANRMFDPMLRQILSDIES